MARVVSAEELATECEVPVSRVEWLARIGILKPRGPGRFIPGDAYRVKMIEAFLRAGFTESQVELGVAAGILNLDVLHRYFREPPPRSASPFARFCEEAGPRGALLPSVYEILGLPRPDPGRPLTTEEEELFGRFLDGWSLAENDETLTRAARLIGEGTRLAVLGWNDLFDEDITARATERFLSDDLTEQEAVTLAEAGAKLTELGPLLMRWLTERYLEQSLMELTAEQFERFMASRGLLPPPKDVGPPSVVFVDLSGFTRTTEERGDEVAAHHAAQLQEIASRISTGHRGRLVKMLGDGAMLHFPRSSDAPGAALRLLREVHTATGVQAHAGCHAGPVFERDRDLFGGTVNVAARIAGVAAAGQVLASDGLREAATEAGVEFQFVGERLLKGVSRPVRLFEVEESTAR